MPEIGLIHSTENFGYISFAKSCLFAAQLSRTDEATMQVSENQSLIYHHDAKSSQA